ncbi:response regulator receiver domain-containing protein [Sinobacterium caligoides]|uniref:Response regulator receiver domain-containing protein n=1 Tax=Sinobacterium caligoides TaxID=933926 RepID=A0A3N2DN81_9GAMM|nr:HDOD domain-containing protein [Sinobacterium caligoides]ROS01109.1 response regulator receiver domain-containing protein [Sinobacterium caligoides]
MRALFVDDDALLLQGMKRAFFASDWLISTASNGDEAMQQLAQQHYDVVVSDIRMPQMSGGELFAKIKQQHPRTIRIVLSGQPGIHAPVATSMVAHHWLDKPCSILELKDTLDRSYQNLQQINSEPLQRLIARAGALPTPPPIILALKNRLKQLSSIDEISQLILRDPGLSAKILHIANASYIAGNNPTNNLHEAVTRLGLDAVHQVVLLAEPHMFNCPQQNKQLVKLQQHARSCAKLAQQIAPSIKKTEAMLAALLHRLGDTLLISCQCSERLPIDISQQISSQLLQLWGFPRGIIEAVLHCRNAETALNDIDDVSQLRSADAIFIANTLLSGGQLDQRFSAQPRISPLLSLWQQSSQSLNHTAHHSLEPQGAAYEP